MAISWPKANLWAGISDKEDKTGFYFDEFPVNRSKNIERNPRICILAVNSDLRLWQKSLFAGRFETPPAVRLMGSVGKNEREQNRR